MFKIAGRPFISLDSFLPLETMPSVMEATIDSYYLIKQNTWQKTINLHGEVTNCNWRYKSTHLRSTRDYFALEVRNKTLAPMWILDLTNDNSYESLNIFDSIKTPEQRWDMVKWREDLPPSWKPFLNWLSNLPCFSKIGRSSLLITRPGIPIFYHRDIGVADEDFVPYEHRQEFIWLNLTPEKTLYILDDEFKPIHFNCRSAFFNHHSWHGSHESLPFWSFSFKIEGIFSEQFRNQIGIAHLSGYRD